MILWGTGEAVDEKARDFGGWCGNGGKGGVWVFRKARDSRV